MPDDTILPFSFPAVGRKQPTAAFDGGRISSDGGVRLFGVVGQRLGIAEKLAGLIANFRNRAFVLRAAPSVASRPGSGASWPKAAMISR